MKKIIFVSLIVVLIKLLKPFSKTELNINNSNTIKIKYYENEITLSSEDTIFIKKLLKGKQLFYDSSSCGFYDDIKITFDNGEEIIPAFDSCDIIQDKKSGKYFSMDDDRENFILIVNKYGNIIRN